MKIPENCVRFNSSVGDILVDQHDVQWRVSDREVDPQGKGFFVLEPLDDDERVKPEFVHSQCNTGIAPTECR